MVKIRKKIILPIVLVAMLVLLLQGVSAISTLDNWKVGCMDNNSVLRIDDADIDDTSLRPGDDIKVDITVANTDNDYEVQDVEMDVYFVKVGGTKQLEDDDEDDIEEEEKFDIDEDEEEDYDYEWTPDQDFDDGDEYKLIVRAKSTDYKRNTSITVCAWDDSESLDFEKKKYELEIYKAVISPAVVECSRSTNLRVGVKNIGQKNIDDAILKITNNELGIDKTTNLDELDKDASDDDNSIDKSNLLDIPEDARAGTYTIDVNLDYKSDKYTEFKSVDLEVKKCVIEDEEDVTTVITQPTTTPTTPTTTTTTDGVVVQPPTTVTEEEKSSVNWLLISIIALEVLVIVGGGIFAIRWALKKR